jgi:site-specific DNA recombinase
MKKVWTLYRVSTKGQVNDDNDIPMQKEACKQFISTKEDWVFDREFYERGVSGWKVSAEDRDELIKIKNGAEKRQFDILLVFMFDRLGRKHNETPHVVEFLSKQGIEVWSVVEGQRQMNNHTDTLLNYITFWQNSGESIKTSQRVREALEQKNKIGGFTGGQAPIGYEIYDTGIKHPKHDKTIKDLRVVEKEAFIVKEIFRLVIEKGYGSLRISRHLEENGIRNRNGNEFKTNHILRIIKNPIYMGRRPYDKFDDDGKMKLNDEWKLQPKNEDWVIIEENEWKVAQSIVGSRKSKKNSDGFDTPTKSILLLSGIVRCGYCGEKLRVSYREKKNVKKDGSISKYLSYSYRCRNGQLMSDIHEVSSFGWKKYEQSVEESILAYMDNQSDVSIRHKSKEGIQRRLTDLTFLLKENETLKKNSEKELKVLNDEITKILLGQSKFTEDMIVNLIDNKKVDISNVIRKEEELKKEIEESKTKLASIEILENESDGWGEKYQNADFSTKKMMLSRVIESLSFKKDEVQLKVNFTGDFADEIGVEV